MGTTFAPPCPRGRCFKPRGHGGADDVRHHGRLGRLCPTLRAYDALFLAVTLIVHHGQTSAASLWLPSITLSGTRPPASATLMRISRACSRPSGESQARSWPHRLGPSVRSCGAHVVGSMVRPPQPFSTNNSEGDQE